MTTYIALLRAVNVGGTGKLAMSDLKSLCESGKFRNVRTYIASGNVLFESTRSEAAVQKTLEQLLYDHVGKSVDVVVRTGAEMAEVLARNPFPRADPRHTVAIFLEEPPPKSALESITGIVDEVVRLGRREIYVNYGPNMGRSKLKIPAAKHGTARNMNTVATLASMALDGAP
ncbi:MAG: DUF1697 domain-containing protein [Gemmatimonadaceae bacterium]